MKRLLFSLMLVFTLICSSSTAFAEEPMPSEEDIQDEQTPEASGRRNQNQGAMIVMFAVAIGATGAYLLKRERPIELSVTDVKPNGDGSYTITWGYRNPNYKKITAEKMDIRVNKGAAIVLKQQDGKEFYPGIREDALITVINRDTSMEWVVNDQKLVVNGSDYIKEDTVSSTNQ